MQPTAKQALTRDLYNILSTWMFQKALDNDGYSCFLETEAMRLCRLLRWKQQWRHIIELSPEMYSSGLSTKLFCEILMFYGETWVLLKCLAWTSVNLTIHLRLGRNVSLRCLQFPSSSSLIRPTWQAGISSHRVYYTVAFKSVQWESYQTQAQLLRSLNHRKSWFRSWI